MSVEKPEALFRRLLQDKMHPTFGEIERAADELSALRAENARLKRKVRDLENALASYGGPSDAEVM